MMVRIVVALAVSLAAACGAGVAQVPADPALAGRLAAHVRFLSSPELAGREAGSEGERLAAEHIADAFGTIGLDPFPSLWAGREVDARLTSYVQPFPVFPGGEPAPCAEGPGPEPRSPASFARNVLGIVDGDRQGRTLVIGAHYDHLGTKEGIVCPGADDNASGVALLIELARVYAADNPHDGPVIFVAFTGEEIGLLGSRAYVCDPPCPLEKTAAMVNIDMVGRLRGKPLLVAVEGLTDSARASFLRAAGSEDLALAEMRSGYEAGDLAPFAAAGVPSLMLFTGPHADYHRPTDTEEKIDYEGLARVVLFAARAAPLFARFAEDGFHGGALPLAAPSSPAEERPFLGTVPDFTALGGDGVLIAEVVPGSPAEKAGILPGDRVVGLGNMPVKDLRGYADALRARKPGDVVSVELLRGMQAVGVEAVLVKKPEGSGGGHPGGP
ncbi:MAG: M20/M25/M40 family metallo-hydrolase [Candidatus Eisenbacteria bacterium]